MTLDERRALCGVPVTLNGKRAAIGGARNEFASVADLESGLSGEWAWETVALVVSRGGAFKS